MAFHPEQEASTCDECESRLVTTGGEIYCAGCGLVTDAQTFDAAPIWKTDDAGNLLGQQHGPRFEQLAAWNLREMEADFARAMLKDGLAQEEIVALLLSMRHHHDPLYVGFTEGEIAEVQSTVEVAWADFTGLLDEFRDEDE